MKKKKTTALEQQLTLIYKQVQKVYEAYPDLQHETMQFGRVLRDPTGDRVSFYFANKDYLHSTIIIDDKSYDFDFNNNGEIDWTAYAMQDNEMTKRSLHTLKEVRKAYETLCIHTEPLNLKEMAEYKKLQRHNKVKRLNREIRELKEEIKQIEKE